MSSTPQAIIVGGPNGAGKTTLAEELLLGLSYRYLGADRIAAQLAPHAPESVAVQAGREFLRQVRTAVDAHENVIIETTLSGRSFRHVFEDLRRAGYYTKLVFIFLKTAQSHVDRVQERVRKGGHSVPVPDVVRRYERSKRNFWGIYRFLADEWQLYYNADRGFAEVATGGRNGFLVLREAEFDIFLKGVIR